MRFIFQSIVLLTFLSGCYPVSQLQSARTIPKGDLQLAAAASWDRVTSTDDGDEYPGPAVGVRVGITGRLDIGLVVQPSSTQVGMKCQLLRGEVDLALSESFVLARDGMVHFDDEHQRVYDDANVAASKTSFYVGVGGESALEAWIAPTLDLGARWNRYDGEHYSEPFAAAGMLFGMKLALGDVVAIQPELGFAAPFAGAKDITLDDGPGELPLGPGDIRTEATVAFMFEF